METNPFINNPFAPTPPAPPQSGLAEVVGGSSISGMDPELEDAYNVAMAEPEPEMGLFAPVPPVAPVAPVSPASESVEPVDEVVEVVERKRARRFHADTPFVLGVLLFLVAALAAASFYVSFSGLYAAAAWAVGDVPPLQFAVPIMLDVAIVAFTLALFVERERGERVWGTWLAIAVFAGASATANILHTLEVTTAVTLGQLIVGAVISGGAPILLAFATDKIAVKVFKSSE
jgi:hypothetical protein